MMQPWTWWNEFCQQACYTTCRYSFFSKYDCSQQISTNSRIFNNINHFYLQDDASSPTTEKDRLNTRDNLNLANLDAKGKASPALLLAAGKGLKQGKEIASKTAEYISENTYKYSEEAKIIAQRQIEVAMTHWRTR